MGKFYDAIDVRSRGAWVVHHAQKTVSTINGAAEFPALDTAGKAASLLSQLAASEQTVIPKARVTALAQAAGLNTRLELPALQALLQRRRVIDVAETGDIAVLGLTSRATVQHAAEVFEDQEPTPEERASIAIAELTSNAPLDALRVNEFVSDEFRLANPIVDDLLSRSELIGFVDSEGEDRDKLYFNGYLFRRDSLDKVTRVLSSMTAAEQIKVTELDARIDASGCIGLSEAEFLLSRPLFAKLRAAGMYDVNHVANPSGEHGFVTKPAAFHKFNDPVTDDAFDLAKALVSALTFGMTQSAPGRGKIDMITALLGKLIAGGTVGPATAIGEDYRVLETKGVLRVTKAPSRGHFMRLLKRDIGEMALSVLTTGEASTSNTVDRFLPGSMTGYSGPEKTRSAFRQRQVPASKRLTYDVLDVLRTGGL